MKRVQLLVLLVTLALVPSIAQGTVFSLVVLDAGTGNPVQDALVYVNGDYAGKTTASGEFPYSHALNASFYLKVTKVGYEDQVSLIEPDRISGQVMLSRKDLTLTVTLFDGTTFQPVSGALVTLSGENISASAQSDVNGRALLTAKSYGQYSVEVRVPHYETLIRTVETGTADTSVQFWLYRSDQLVIQARDAATGTAIGNATVTVDGVLRGDTDPSGRLLLFLEKERNYQIRVESPGYSPYAVDRYLATGDIVLAVPLSRETERVTLSAFDEDRRPVEGADVLVDGVLVAATDAYGRASLLSVEHGRHDIVVKKAGYLAAGGTYEINRSRADLVVDLPFAPGEVVITVRDAAGDDLLLEGARIGINGVESGRTGKDGSYRINLTTSRTYNISAALSGFGAESRDVALPLGAVTFPVEFSLIRNPDYTLLIAVTAGVILILAAIGIRRLQRDRRRSRIFRRR
ncbi:MAG: carboxypeptidase-like regulatory domain-containing protein [Methanomicrobiales archaeon]|nr:carboxypeptidase-like regulatory domain-containing protein [Methanomicrobiales archaeon]